MSESIKLLVWGEYGNLLNMDSWADAVEIEVIASYDIEEIERHLTEVDAILISDKDILKLVNRNPGKFVDWSGWVVPDDGNIGENRCKPLMYDGKIYGLPWFSDVRVIYANTRMTGADITTWEDLYNTCSEVVGTNLLWVNDDFTELLLLTMGFYKENGELNYSSIDLAFDYLGRFTEQGFIDIDMLNADNMDALTNNMMDAEDFAAFIIGGFRVSIPIKEYGTESDWQIFNLPSTSTSNGEEEFSIMAGGYSWMVIDQGDSDRCEYVKEILYNTFVGNEDSAKFMAENFYIVSDGIFGAGAPNCELGYYEDFLNATGALKPIKYNEYASDYSLKLKELTVKVVYGEMTAEQAKTEFMAYIKNNGMSVSQNKLDHIEIIGSDEQKKFFVGETLDATGLKMIAYYQDGVSREIPPSEWKYDKNFSWMGFHKVKVAYVEGEITKETEFTITVYQRTLSSISVNVSDLRREYLEGEKFDSTGMIVTATYGNGAKRVVSEYSISPGGVLLPSMNSVTVSCTENGITKTTSIPITVQADTLVRINVDMNSIRTDYYEWEAFDRTGLKVYAVYEKNNRREEIEDYKIQPSGALGLGTESVTISYIYGDETFQTTISVTVSESPGINMEESVSPIYKTFSIAGVGTGEVDLRTGEMTATFCDVASGDSVMGLDIVHVYKRGSETHCTGRNFRLNFDERFVKSDDDDKTIYIYTDAKGEKYGFKEYYYFIDTTGQKKYIDNKSDIAVQTDGSLKYNGFDVESEYRSQTGLKAITRPEGFAGIKLFEARSDEYKQLDEQVKSYENAYKEFVLMNTETGNILNNTPSQEKIFGTLTNTEMMLPKSEALQYKSLKTQLDELQETYAKGNITFPTVVKHNNNTWDFYAKTGNIKSVLASLKLSIEEISDELIRYTKNCRNDDAEKTDQDAIVNAINNNQPVTPEMYEMFEDKYCQYPKFREADGTAAENTPRVSGTDLYEMFRQRNLMLLQLQTQEEQLQKQENLVTKQIELIKNKKTLYVEQVQNYYKEYKNKSDELELLKRQTPINFLTDGTIIKGYNEEGNLVAVYDNYENYAVIEYEAYRISSGTTGYRIKSFYDNNNKQVSFAYRPSDNLLETITDTRGRKVQYAYSGSVLTEIRYDDGTTLKLNLSDDFLRAVENLQTFQQTEFSYENRKLQRVDDKSTVKTISLSGVETQPAKEVAFLQFTYSTTYFESSTVVSDGKGVREKYIFNTNGKGAAHYVEELGVVTSAEKYEWEPYKAGAEYNDVQQTPYREVIQARKEKLYGNSLENFRFPVTSTDIYTEKAILNAFEKPVEVTTDRKTIGFMETQDKCRVSSKTEYIYDNEHRVSEEKITTEYSNRAYPVISHKKYWYNAYGSVVKTESWTEDEENTAGRSIEETVYDEKGNVIKSFTYNSLDSGAKFYTESEYAEDGCVTADVDATGEHKTKYEYVPGTNIVRTEVYPNGSKLSYGHDLSDTVTCITQSTEEGEENSNQIIYTCGKATEIRSGNNTVGYTYDYKGRVLKVTLNGVDYLENSYTDGEEYDTVRMKYVSREVDSQADIFEVTKNKRGDMVGIKYGLVNRYAENPALYEQYRYTYDDRFRVKEIEKGGCRKESYEYDELDRETKHTFEEHIHETEYDEYGSVKKEAVRYNGSATDKTEYGYTYSEDSARRLTGQTVDGYTESYETDCLGRSRKVTQTLGGKTYSKSYGYYKVGDHATNLINTIYYGKDGKTSGKETYTYDGMGNIVSVSRDGKQKKAYTYDALNRIISEKDIDKEKEICYTYDNNGNILTKSVNGVVTAYAYEEGTDRLTSYGDKTIEYDGMGNPKSYRGSELTWEKGRQLTKMSKADKTIQFGYDALGMRISREADGVRTEYIYEGDRLLRQITGSEVMTFIYGSEGIIGFKLGTSRYLYRKNVFGDVEEIYSAKGTLVGKYRYTAFGECEIETDANGIATKNPIRYRGYYFDEETGFYYLKTRYYDPETGRFITIDDVSYLAPDTINGLNLYAYCGNNPVMRIDENGTAWWHWLVGALVVTALVVGTVVSAGGLGAGLMAIGLAANGMVMAGASMATTIFAFATVGAGVAFAASGIVAGMGAIETWMTGGSFSDGLNEVSSYGSVALGNTSGGAIFGGIAGYLSYKAVLPEKGKSYGTYLIKDKDNNVIYVGKGDFNRMNVSMRERGGASGSWFKAEDELTALIKEALWINDYGGPQSMKGSLLNKINSPGLKYLIWWLS